jgi:hypothetical protein
MRQHVLHERRLADEVPADRPVALDEVSEIAGRRKP